MNAHARLLAALALLSPWLQATATADVVMVPADQDNTLFEDVTGSLSNGAGPVLYAGNNGQDLARRALLRFDVGAAVPRGRRIEQVTLTLNVSNAPNTIVRAFTLQRVLESWGEGTSSTTSGSGAAATDGDATWIHTRWPDALWTVPGGGFRGTPSATQQVAGIGLYSWTDPEMTVDVQSWIDDPASNQGWLLLGDETVLNTARRFDSRENAVPENRPVLAIRYSGTLGVGDLGPPAHIGLGPCAPNPARGAMRIVFSAGSGSHARLEVVDPGGRHVTTLVDGVVGRGSHVVTWDGAATAAGHTAAGVYFLLLTVDGRPQATARVVRLQ
jgi:hypothetical protein